MDLSNSLADFSLASLFNKEQATLDNETLRYGFVIGSLNFIYPPHTPCEVVRSSSIYPIPNTPVWMLGLINLRGGLVPVFNLENYFDFNEEPDKHKLLLVLGKREKSVAVQIKHYPQLLKNLTKLDDIPKLLPKISEHINAAYQDDGVWLELNADSFFSQLGQKVCI